MNILITGGCGSLGKEFVKYLKDFNSITVIDNNEWAVAEFQKQFTCKIILEDFSEWKYDQDPCDAIIHCAAYKHLPLGEENPNSFIDNNIIKTRKLFAEAYKNNVDILFISTDKAVEPCNLYGHTKAIGEKLCTHYNGSVARCGNFIGSSGSVIPVWEKCLKDNAPLPVTDLEMKRFIIDPKDAARKIWAGFIAGKKLIIPEMKEVKLTHLIQTVLKLHRKPLDYPIKIIGRRKGEKMTEKIRWDHEQTNDEYVSSS